MTAALHHAAEAGHEEVVGMLVIAGTNVQRVDTRGFTAAHLAASQGHADVLDKLFMAGERQQCKRQEVALMTHYVLFLFQQSPSP